MPRRTTNPLKPGTTYYYRIMTTAAILKPVKTVLSTVVSATTVAAAPDRPQDLTATADGENAIDLEWNVHR